MKDDYKIENAVSEVFMTINETNDILEHIKCENQIACMFAPTQTIFGVPHFKKDMAAIIERVALLTGIYILINISVYQSRLSYSELITQLIFLLIMIIVLSTVHKINTDRYDKLRMQFKVVVEQKNDIAELYKEISTKEELLRQQNAQLISYTEEIKKNEKKLYDLAYFDALTGLPNRKMFIERLDSLIEKSKHQTEIFYIVFIDMDSFKKINDTMGHRVGDKFIQIAADNLKQSIHEGDMLGRIGGDEFALIISRDLNKEEVFKEVDAIRKSFSKPFRINNTEVRSTASFGMAVFPYDGDTASEMLESADISMYKAKEFGKNNVQFFEKYMQDGIEQIA